MVEENARKPEVEPNTLATPEPTKQVQLGHSSNSAGLMQWALGIGNEGIFVKPTSSSGNLVIVGKRSPRWGLVVVLLELRIQSILLYELDLAVLVTAYFGSRIPIRQTVANSQVDVVTTKEALKNSSVVMVETLPSQSSSLSWMWHASTIKLVLVAHGTLLPPQLMEITLAKKLSRSRGRSY